MKFTKEDACKELTAKLTEKGETINLSERSINEQTEALLPLLANDETELADFVEKVLPLFRTANANVRNDVSQGIKDFKSKQQPTPPKQEPKKELEKALEERLAALEAELEKTRLESKMNGVKKALSAAIKSKGVTDEEWISALLDEITISEEMDIDAKAQSYLNLYNKSKSNAPKDVTPEDGKGRSSSDDKILSDSIKAAKAYASAQNLIE